MDTLLRATGAVVAVASLLFAAGVWRLSQGPVALGFLAPPLERALAAERPEFDVSLGGLTLGWSGAARAFGIAAFDVHARRRDGAVRIQVPEMTVSLDGPALLRGTVAPRRLEVFGPAVHVLREPPPPAGPDDAGGADDNGLVGAFGGTLRRAPEILRMGGRLSVLEVSDATVVARGPAAGAGETWRFARISVERRGESVFATAAATAALDGEPFDFEAEARYDPGSGALAVRTMFADLVPARLAALSPALSSAAEYDLRVGGEVVVESAGDGRIDAVSFDLSGGPGVVPAPPPYRPGTRMAVAEVRAAGRLDDGFRRLSLDRAEVDLFGPTVAMRGEIGGDWASPDVALDILAHAAPLDDLEALWPHETAPGARPWAVANMSGGMLETLEVRVDVRGDQWDAAYLPADSVDGRLRVVDAAVRYMDGLPPARGVRAAGRFDALGLTAEIEAARAGPLTVPGGTVEIRDTPEDAGRARLELAFAGDLGETLAVLRQSSLGLGGIDIDPARVSGAVEGDLALSVPLDAAEGDAVDFGVAAALRHVAVAPAPGGGLAGNRDIRAAALDLSVRADGFELSGDVTVDGIPAGGVWRETFASAGAAPRRRIDFSTAVDTESRERLGLGVPWLSGPVAVDGRIVATGDETTTIDIDLDAGDAAADLPALPWLKPAGEAAAARLALVLRGEEVAAVSRFELTADDLVATGSAALSDEDVWEVRIERFASGLTDVSGEVLAAGESVTALLQGAGLDLRAAGRGAAAESDESALPPLLLSATVDTLALDEGLTLNAADVLLSWDGREIDKAEIEGRLAGGAPLALRLREAPEAEADRARVLTVDTDDAGQLLHALEITPNMVGGSLAMEARVEGDLAGHPLSGVLRIDDFRMVDAPVLAQLLSLVTVDFIGALEMLGGEGLKFDRFEAPYVYRDGVLTLERALASGVSLGITVDGSIDFRRDDIDIRGQVAPLYALSRVVGAVPLLGDILTGGEGGGVFAVPYRVEGARANPSITVNPLAIVLPGPLRELAPGG